MQAQSPNEINRIRLTLVVEILVKNLSIFVFNLIILSYLFINKISAGISPAKANPISKPKLSLPVSLLPKA